MVRDEVAVEALVELRGAERTLLASQRAPIVLAPRRPGAQVAADAWRPASRSSA